MWPRAAPREANLSARPSPADGHVETETWKPAVIPGKKGGSLDQLFSVLGYKTLVLVSHESCSEDSKIPKTQHFASLAWLLFLGFTVTISTE